MADYEHSDLRMIVNVLRAVSICNLALGGLCTCTAGIMSSEASGRELWSLWEAPGFFLIVGGAFWGLSVWLDRKWRKPPPSAGGQDG